MTLNLNRALSGVLCISFILLASCGGGAGRGGVTPLQAHMYAHYDRAGAVHQSLMDGDLDGARRAAEWIGTHSEIHQLPRGTEHFENAVRRFANRVSGSTEFEEAAVSAARMGGSCGDCHRSQRVEPRFLMATAPPGGDGPMAEMARHVWAADRMWVGLLGPSEAAWLEGAREFQGGWLDTQELLVDPDNRARIREMVRHIYELGARAEDAVGPEERADVYGAFLSTCADCHRLTMAVLVER